MTGSYHAPSGRPSGSNRIGTYRDLATGREYTSLNPPYRKGSAPSRSNARAKVVAAIAFAAVAVLVMGTRVAALALTDAAAGSLGGGR